MVEPNTIIMSRLRNIPETCPIYKEAEQEKEFLIDELHNILNPDVTERIIHHVDALLECVDRCRDISGELREMCVERGEKIEELEEKLGDLVSV